MTTLADLALDDSAPAGRDKINANNAILEAALTAIQSRLDGLERGSGPAGGYNPPANDGIFVYASAPKVTAGKYTTMTRVAQLDLGQTQLTNGVQGVFNWGTDSFFTIMLGSSATSWTLTKSVISGSSLTVQATVNLVVSTGTLLVGAIQMSPTTFRLLHWATNTVTATLVTWNGAGTLTTSTVGTISTAALTGNGNPSNNTDAYLVGSSSVASIISGNSAVRATQILVADRGSSLLGEATALQLASTVNTRPSHDLMAAGEVVVAHASVTPQDSTARMTIWSAYVDDSGSQVKSRLRLGDVVASGISVISLSPTLVAVNWQDGGGLKKFCFADYDPTTGVLSNLGVFAGGNADNYLFQTVFRFSPLKFYASRPGATVTGQVLMLAEFVPATPALVTDPANDIAWDFANGLSPTVTSVLNVRKAEGYADRAVAFGRATIGGVVKGVIEVYDLT